MSSLEMREGSDNAQTAQKKGLRPLGAQALDHHKKNSLTEETEPDPVLILLIRPCPLHLSEEI